MAERLTNTLEETPTKGFGLKFCSDRNCNSDEDCCNCYAFNQTINKLRQLEDIMEKYGIENIEVLEQELKTAHEIEIIKRGKIDLSNSAIVDKDFYKDFTREIEKLETDRDTWKRACELACDVLRDINYKIYNEDRIDFENTFYQQAKTEGNDE